MVVERGFTVAEASVVLVGSVALAEVDELLSDELLDELLVGLLEGGLNAAGRSREGAQAPGDG